MFLVTAEVRMLSGRRLGDETTTAVDVAGAREDRRAPRLADLRGGAAVQVSGATLTLGCQVCSTCTLCCLVRQACDGGYARTTATFFVCTFNCMYFLAPQAFGLSQTARKPGGLDFPHHLVRAQPVERSQPRPVSVTRCPGRVGSSAIRPPTKTGGMRILKIQIVQPPIFEIQKTTAS